MSQPPRPTPGVPKITHPLLTQSLSTLYPLSEILQGLHHRNKNQHSSSKWWSSFDILRRNVFKLIAEMEDCIEIGQPKKKTGFVHPVNYSITKKREKKVRKCGEGVEKVVKRARFMREGVVPKGWEGFGRLVGDRQFSQVGLALVGVLGGVHQVIGGLLPAEETEGEDEEVVIGEEGQGMGVEEEVEVQEGGQEMDMGEKVEREEVMVSVERDIDRTKTTKKKIGGDEFENIFASLVTTKSSKKKAVKKRDTSPLDLSDSDNNNSPPSPQQTNNKVSNLGPDDLDNPIPNNPPSKKKKNQADKFDDIFGSLEDKPRKKKKKAAGDEFDDIFGGLGKDEPKKKKKKVGGGDESDGIFGGLGDKPRTKVEGEKRRKKKNKKDEFDDIFAGF